MIPAPSSRRAGAATRLTFRSGPEPRLASAAATSGPSGETYSPLDRPPGEGPPRFALPWPVTATLAPSVVRPPRPVPDSSEQLYQYR